MPYNDETGLDEVLETIDTDDLVKLLKGEEIGFSINYEYGINIKLNIDDDKRKKILEILEQNKIIDDIYDYFESRNCGNCKYNKKEDGFMIFCDSVMCQDGSKMMWHSFTKDFCCNKWESK